VFKGRKKKEKKKEFVNQGLKAKNTKDLELEEEVRSSKLKGIIIRSIIP